MKKTFRMLIYIFAAIGFVLVAGYVAIQLGFTKTAGIIDSQHDYFKDQTGSQADVAWSQDEEWQVLKEAILKDTDSINAAAQKADMKPRMIVAVLIVEQLRLFHTDREVFKSVFAPLKILGTQSQFSWGVMGIKQDTAKQIESNLKDSSSVWYPGQKYEHLLDFPATTTDPDSERFARLTDEHDRSYSYLYAALNMKELEAQWQKAAISISDRPEIVATLFNIGFANSHPHADPLSGGAEIDIGTTTYSFGGLAGSFYYSDEMTDAFPR
jgi:hypothetical protein